ncbi:hypothetical protein BGZ76_010339 [Entomortierella beljakovae]|nr:hypothetical protein BGZ76_010339 [Entomortierella beljakovae]
MVLIEETDEYLEELFPNNKVPEAPTEADGDLKPFLNLSREQCHILLALYHVVDPTLEPQVTVLFPAMAVKFQEDLKERNSVVSKLERADEKYAQEVLNLQEIQKAVATALLNSDMDVEKARGFLKMKSEDTPKEELTIQEVLTNGFLLGGIRDQGQESTKNASPLSSPNFREAKSYYDYAFEKFGFSMAAVQLGSFYLHEHKHCNGENCQEGENPEQISLDYYLKAANVGNPMAMHKVGWHYDQKGEWHKAIEWYIKAADQGFPDAAHNLGMMYQEGNSKSEPKLEVNIPKAIEYYNRGLEYNYGASGTQLGRIFFMLATDKDFREKLPSSDPNHTEDPREYFEAAISYFNKANHLLEVESLQFLGMIYGSKDFGYYNIDSAQNLFELALIASNGGQQPFEYLCRTLSARRAILEDQLAASGSTQAPQKVDGSGIKTCAAKSCENTETKKDQFQRCGGCKKRYYCSRLCQVNDWKDGHKKSCKK